jgi:hypothetical protein
MKIDNISAEFKNIKFMDEISLIRGNSTKMIIEKKVTEP